MSLRKAVAAPFRAKGRERVAESEFVVALSLDRDWFSPDQAKRLIDVAVGEGLLDRTDGELVVSFDPDDEPIPDGFHPDESVIQERSTFQRVLDALVDTGIEKQDAVAAINALQSEAGITIEAAAVLYAHKQGVDVGTFAERARADLAS
ncbi:DUF2240 family protein [Halomarina oriensis]|uniref:DUF2240 family protein n=1 Tax=Halomarina oriensis TaxID=671145 RepID=A0A6B0GQC6_9EURY|nr:DUF2240 family protein [Halomarina oriensis]MWG35799.1 DUF2240 family protein [Halomarina oriensis]